MTLKHSSKAKWAKKQRMREHRDPAVSPLSSALFLSPFPLPPSLPSLSPLSPSLSSLSLSLPPSFSFPPSHVCNDKQTQQALSEHHNKKQQLKQKSVMQEDAESTR